jgi:predicted membrane-bound spermidine synthase
MCLIVVFWFLFLIDSLLVLFSFLFFICAWMSALFIIAIFFVVTDKSSNNWGDIKFFC